MEYVLKKVCQFSLKTFQCSQTNLELEVLLHSCAKLDEIKTGRPVGKVKLDVNELKIIFEIEKNER